MYPVYACSFALISLPVSFEMKTNAKCVVSKAKLRL